MAEQETTVPLNDTDLMASALADEPKQETPAAPEPSTEPDGPKADATGRLHGEGGRFVSKQATTDAAPTQQQAEPETNTQVTPPANDDSAAHVPSWRLREVREAREAADKRAEEAQRQAYASQQEMAALRRELAELRKPKPEPVDFFSNPEGAFQQQLSPFEERLNSIASNMVYRASLAEAIAEHGRQSVDEMRDALKKAHQQGNPDIANLDRLMSQSDDPVGVAMKWHKQAKLQSEVGNDLTAYKAKLRAELLQDAGFRTEAMAAWTGQAQQAAAQPGARPAIQLPPSLHRQTGTAHDPAADDNDMSDAALYRHATARGR